MSDHHRQMIRYSLKHLEFVEEQIGELRPPRTPPAQLSHLGKLQDRLAMNAVQGTKGLLQDLCRACGRFFWFGFVVLQ